MTVTARLTAAWPEAKRIADLLERAFGEEGAAIALDEMEAGWAVEALFEDAEPAEIAARIRERLGGDAFGAALVVERLVETDWVARGLEGLKPVAVGRFLIHGCHDRSRIPRGRVAVEIAAGQAFGTGHHATTAGCLSVLDRLIRARRFARPLDLGTGSGVLAIALAKSLRRPVLATDIDPVAVAVARQNAHRNRVAHLVRVITADGVRHAEIRACAPFDLVVANILAGPLIRLAPPIARMLAPGGMLVVSGLLPAQAMRVTGAYAAQGVRLVRAEAFAGWTVLLMRRP
jgi:ribosomal protein L11 methyltransferase